MASRILQSALANQKSRVGICCAFILTAAVVSYSCPFSSAAGVTMETHYEGSDGMIGSSENNWEQSDQPLSGFLSAGQQTLTGGTKTLMLAVGRSEFLSQQKIDANDHQKFSGTTQGRYSGGGMILDSARLTTEVAAAKTNGVKEANGTGLPFPIDESVVVEKGVMGSSAEYRTEKEVGQGAVESTDYLLENTYAKGTGTFINRVDAVAEVSFDPFANEPYYRTETHVRDTVTGFNATSLFTWESFGDVFKNPVNQTNVTEQS